MKKTNYYLKKAVNLNSMNIIMLSVSRFFQESVYVVTCSEFQ